MDLRNDFYCLWLDHCASHPHIWSSGEKQKVISLLGLNMNKICQWWCDVKKQNKTKTTISAGLNLICTHTYISKASILLYTESNQPEVFLWDWTKAVALTFDLKRRLMTPFERLSAVRSEVPQTDMLLLSLLALGLSTSSAPPATVKDRPTDKLGI